MKLDSLTNPAGGRGALDAGEGYGTRGWETPASVLHVLVPGIWSPESMGVSLGDERRCARSGRDVGRVRENACVSARLRATRREQSVIGGGWRP